MTHDTELHPDELALQAWLEHPEQADAPLRAHVEGCQHCRDIGARYTALNALLVERRLALQEERLPEVRLDALVLSVQRAQAQNTARTAGLEGIPGRLQGMLLSFGLISLASALLLLPRVARVDLLALDVVGVLKALGALSVGLDAALPVLLAVAEPMRLPALLVGAGMTLTLAWMLSRRERTLLLSMAWHGVP